MTDREAEHAKFVNETSPITLQEDPGEWEEQLCHATADEFVPPDHPNLALRGMHLYTAVAHLLKDVTEIRECDDSGGADMACLIGNEEEAHEHVGELYVTGVRRMGEGRTLQQIQLSKTAAKGMAGGTPRGLSPSYVATFFIQLFKAGSRHREKCPFDKTYKGPGQGSSSNDKDPTKQEPLPEEALEPIIRSHYEEAPTGVKRATIDTAIRRQAESPGRTFAGGQMSYLPGFGGKVKEGGAAGMGNGSCVVLPGQRVSAAHVALSIAAAHQADATACDAGEANLMSDDFRARTHALATRKFTGNPHWSSSKLLPATQDASRGTTRAALALGFGPFEKGITTGLIGKTGTTAADLPLYLGVVTVLTWMRILDAPSIDEGFREELSYWIDNTPRFRNHAVPFCLVAKELGLPTRFIKSSKFCPWPPWAPPGPKQAGRNPRTA
jgi:hypothetical protein